MHEPVIPAENTRCHRCGGLLGMGQAMLLRAETRQVDQIPQDPLGLLESSLQRHMDEMASDPARVLETLREQMGRSRSGNVHPLRRLLLRLRRMLKGPSSVGHFGYAAFKGDMFCRTLPQPFDEHIILPASLPVHADLDPIGFQQAGEGVTCELASLICVEYLRRAVASQGFFERLHALR